MTNIELYKAYVWSSAEGRRVVTSVYAGEVCSLDSLHPGTEFEIPDTGERGVVVRRYSKSSIVRMTESQECPKVGGELMVRPLQYMNFRDTTGYPRLGQFVEIRTGEHRGKLGMVSMEGAGVTYVNIGGLRDRLRISSRDLIIVKDARIVRG